MNKDNDDEQSNAELKTEIDLLKSRITFLETKVSFLLQENAKIQGIKSHREAGDVKSVACNTDTIHLQSVSQSDTPARMPAQASIYE